MYYRTSVYTQYMCLQKVQGYLYLYTQLIFYTYQSYYQQITYMMWYMYRYQYVQCGYPCISTCTIRTYGSIHKNTCMCVYTCRMQVPAPAIEAFFSTCNRQMLTYRTHPIYKLHTNVSCVVCFQPSHHHHHPCLRDYLH